MQAVVEELGNERPVMHEILFPIKVAVYFEGYLSLLTRFR